MTHSTSSSSITSANILSSTSWSMQLLQKWPKILQGGVQPTGETIYHSIQQRTPVHRCAVQTIYIWLGNRTYDIQPQVPQIEWLGGENCWDSKAHHEKVPKSRSDIPTALLHLRATPVDSKTPSPGELLFGRQISTTLISRAEPKGQHLEIRDHLYNRLPSSSNNVLQPLYPGQPVRVRDEESKTWQPGTILDKLPQPHSYIVETENGSQLRGNRQHLRH